jgi:1,4-alpha-glucan branching enzyme
MNQVISHSLFSDLDIYLFKAGQHFRLYEKFGSHLITVNGVSGVYFSVWAPAAQSVAVIGNFNYWDGVAHPLQVRWDRSGIWEGFIPGIVAGEAYKYQIVSQHKQCIQKADPFAKFCETPPKSASIVWDLTSKWKDAHWMKNRAQYNSLDKPFSVYEVHFGSWRKNALENRSLTYREAATELVNYVLETGFTHVELLPIMEYPYEPSWGYQLIGYFAPTSRFGSPQDFMYLIDQFHQNNIGVILDWVPSHFPEDIHGLGYFDGSNLYEHPDKRKGFHPDWKSLIFNYERAEVRSFLISNALFWLDYYHIDGLRVDAVASMIYLDYSREQNEWEPNIYGGNENLAAVHFLKDFNAAVYGHYPDVQTIAEESTSFSKVSHPIDLGGLGFGMKWMMGWMHDSLHYLKKNPIHRKYHQDELTFSMTYAFTENFMLSLSHDEVVHGKSSLLGRMPGDEWQKFANLRLLYSYMFTHPGANLLFMGSEFGQHSEWNFQESLDWHLLDYQLHKGIQNTLFHLNLLYKSEPALYEKQFSHEGFEWINHGDSENSVLSYIRKGVHTKDDLITICNFTPQVLDKYQVGLPKAGALELVFNSDEAQFGGSEVDFENISIAQQNPWNGKSFSAEFRLPPLGVLVYKYIN